MADAEDGDAWDYVNHDWEPAPPRRRGRRVTLVDERLLADRDALIAEMREVLVRMEWKADKWGDYYCPDCDASKACGHWDWCKLRALLDRTKAYGGEDETR